MCTVCGIPCYSHTCTVITVTPPDTPPLSPFATEQPIAYDIAKHMRSWSSIAFYLAVAINLMVAFFYPFDKGSEYVGKFTPWGSYWISKFGIDLEGMN